MRNKNASHVQTICSPLKRIERNQSPYRKITYMTQVHVYITLCVNETSVHKQNTYRYLYFIVTKYIVTVYTHSI